MEGGSGFSNLNKTVRKKRSNRARTNSQSGFDNRENSPHSGSKASSDENNVDFTNSSRKELNLNQIDSRVLSYINAGEADNFVKNSYENGEFVEFGEGISENKDNKNNININKANEIKLKRVKLKLGGVTRTLHANFSEPSQIDATLQQKQNPQEDTDSDSPPQHKGTSLRGIPWKDFSNNIFSDNKKATEPVRKSKRVPKIKLLDDDDDHHYHDDMEIRFLEKLRNSKFASAEGDDDEDDDDELSGKKHRKISRVMNMSENAGDYSSLSVKENRKSRSEKVSDDNDYREFADVAVMDSKIEMAITTRQRAYLQTIASPVEFPNGLPLAPPKKQKEKLNDVEQQLKKAEAAQKRKIQVEKAARDSEAEAIRKILGQDSSRKKREDKIKKRQEELAQERTANVKTLAGNTVRWNMGPTGTTVTFPEDTGLPSILEPKPYCYPPPREKCAGPFCTNPYKYRDSKSRLPLCSLRCYKAIHEKTQPLSAC